MEVHTFTGVQICGRTQLLLQSKCCLPEQSGIQMVTAKHTQGGCQVEYWVEEPVISTTKPTAEVSMMPAAEAKGVRQAKQLPSTPWCNV